MGTKVPAAILLAMHFMINFLNSDSKHATVKMKGMFATFSYLTRFCTWTSVSKTFSVVVPLGQSVSLQAPFSYVGSMFISLYA